VIRDILRVDGLRGPFRGWGVTAARDLGYGSYFLVYEGMCRALHPSNGNRKAERTNHASLAEEAEHEITTLSIPRLLLAGGLAGVAGWTSTFAFDVVKTRVQGAQGCVDAWEWAEGNAADSGCGRNQALPRHLGGFTRGLPQRWHQGVLYGSLANDRAVSTAML